MHALALAHTTTRKHKMTTIQITQAIDLQMAGKTVYEISTITGLSLSQVSGAIFCSWAPQYRIDAAAK